MRTLYRFDDEGYYNGSIVNDNHRVIYPNTTEIEPVFEDGCRARWNGSEWVLELIPIPEPEPEPEPTQRELYEKEIDELKSFLKSTDYCVVKCYEMGLDVATEYPEEHATRIAARERINELEKIINISGE